MKNEIVFKKREFLILTTKHPDGDVNIGLYKCIKDVSPKEYNKLLRKEIKKVLLKEGKTFSDWDDILPKKVFDKLKLKGNLVEVKFNKYIFDLYTDCIEKNFLKEDIQCKKNQK